MTLCSSLTLVKDLGVNQILAPLLCRSWYCDTCGPIRQARLRKLVESGEPTSFITLGVRGRDDGGQAARANALRDAWQTVARRAKREAARDPERRPRFKQRQRHWRGAPEDQKSWPRHVTLDGPGLPYLAVFEATEKGEPHIHIAARVRWIEQPWLSREMDSLIGAPNVWIERVRDSRSLGWYVSKYMAKEPRAWPGCKRYWRSQDFALVEIEDAPEVDEPSTEWERVTKSVEALAAEAHQHGWRVEWLGHSARVWRPLQ